MIEITGAGLLMVENIKENKRRNFSREDTHRIFRERIIFFPGEDTCRNFGGEQGTSDGDRAATLITKRGCHFNHQERIFSFTSQVSFLSI